MELILASSGKPFRDKDAAEIKRRRMQDELGSEFELRVVSLAEGGYAIQQSIASLGGEPGGKEDAAASPREELIATLAKDRPRAPASMAFGVPKIEEPPRRAREASDGEPKKQPLDLWSWLRPREQPKSAQAVSAPGQDADAARDATLTLNPALRAFPFKAVLTVAGIALMLRPSWLFGTAAIDLPEDPDKARFLIITVSVLAFVTTLYAMLQVMWAYLANTYILDRRGIEQVQWYFHRGWPRRRRPRLEWNQIRAISIDQSMVQTLLGVGHLRIASAGTGTYEIELLNISRPRALEKEIQARRAALRADDL